VTENAGEVFRQLLRERVRDPARAREIDEEIVRRFETACAVMMTDTVGFTRGTRDMGIIHVMSLLLFHGELLSPVVARNKGEVLKREADNILAVFPTVVGAVDGARDMNRALRNFNRDVDSESRIRICIGIGFGPVLRVGQDVWGDEVNQASKLGEDTALAEEILLSTAAWEQVRGRYRFAGQQVVAAEGVPLKYYRLVE
jgi:class 3 adenylate cyclase